MALDDAYTKSLLHFDGADASTVFTDEIGKVWTPVGTAQLDTAAQKFGSASALFDGNSDSIYTVDSDWNLGASDFTIDFWVKSAQTTQYATLVSKCPAALGSGMWSILTSYTNAGDIAFTVHEYDPVGHGNMLITAGSLFNTNSWVHVAVVRYGNDWTIYVDGVSKATRNTATTINALTAAVYIGQHEYTGIRWYNGWMDEFRFSNVARWTAAFTPPTVEYRPHMNYLHARRDRMDMRPVSTHNRLA